MLEFVIGASAFIIATVLGIAGYFIQKWISVVDETLKEHGRSISTLSTQVGSLESAQAISTENLSQAIHAQAGRTGPRFEQLEIIQEDVRAVKTTMQTRVLPQLERTQETLGKVIVIEKKLSDQDGLLRGLFQIQKQLAADRKSQGPG